MGTKPRLLRTGLASGSTRPDSGTAELLERSVGCSVLTLSRSLAYWIMLVGEVASSPFRRDGGSLTRFLGDCHDVNYFAEHWKRRTLALVLSDAVGEPVRATGVRTCDRHYIAGRTPHSILPGKMEVKPMGTLSQACLTRCCQMLCRRSASVRSSWPWLFGTVCGGVVVRCATLVQEAPLPPVTPRPDLQGFPRLAFLPQLDFFLSTLAEVASRQNLYPPPT